MSRLYEGMFLLDNAVVRESWDTAKSVVTSALEKHGAEVVSARRWDERRLAYPIKGRKRATYLLAYCKADGERIQHLRRDLELDERVLRHMILSAESLPDGELDLAAAESSADFHVPAPPEDDAVVVEESTDRADEAKPDEAKKDEAKKDEAKKDETKKDAPKEGAKAAAGEGDAAPASAETDKEAKPAEGAGAEGEPAKSSDDQGAS